jgi:class 3 adenylate cyclase
MTGDELRRTALSGRALSATEIVELFEQWRYGRGVALTIAIFTKRPKKPGVNFAAQVSAALTKQLDEENASKDERELAPVLIGEDAFDDGHVIELPFRYGRLIHYLDMAERPRSVASVRFGFVWISARDQFVAITGHTGVVGRLLSAVGQAIGTQPLKVAFDKATLDKNFDLSKLTSILQQELERGIRTRVSGEQLYEDDKRIAEIKERDEESVRLGARYREDLSAGVHVSVGVNAQRSRVHTSQSLSSTTLREWAVPKITAMARSLLELQQNDPIAFYQLSSGAALPGVPRVHADLVRRLAASIALCRKKGLDVLPGSTPIAELARLPQDAGRLVARVHCGACADHVLALCGVCLESRVTRDEDRVRCAEGHDGGFSCEAGHAVRADDLLEDIVYQPERKLLEWMSDGLVDMGQAAYDPTREQFWVRPSDLLYVGKRVVPLSREYAVLYMDIEDSTKLQSKRASYTQLLRLTRRALASATRATGGRFAGDTGDGGFSVFESPKAAVDAAQSIQAEICTSPLNTVGAVVRIGIAWGHIDTSGGTFEGRAINLAARLQAKATKGTRIAVDAKIAYAIRTAVKTTEFGSIRSLKGFEADANDETYFLVEVTDYARQQKKGA